MGTMRTEGDVERAATHRLAKTLRVQQFRKKRRRFQCVCARVCGATGTGLGKGWGRVANRGATSSYIKHVSMR